MSKERTELEVPQELLSEFDKATEGRYANRSEAIRDAMRLLLEKLSESKGVKKWTMSWGGNMTVKMDEKEDTYSPIGTVEVEKYSDVGFALKIVGGEGRCSVIMRMTKNDCKDMMKKFLEVV